MRPLQRISLATTADASGSRCGGYFQRESDLIQSLPLDGMSYAEAVLEESAPCRVPKPVDRRSRNEENLDSDSDRAGFRGVGTSVCESD